MERIFEARLHEIIPMEHPAEPCSVQCCDPQNEMALIRRGLLKGPCECPEFMYICKYGLIHECSPQSGCMFDGPCLVSGLTEGIVENVVDEQSWLQSSTSIKSNVRPTLYSNIENIIETLLYSSVRERIYRDWDKQQSKRLRKYKEVYAQKCYRQGIPTNLIEMAMLEDHHYISCPTRDVLNRDPDRVYAYTKAVADMYEKIQHLYKDERICIESVTLGLLYKMQQGVIVDGKVLIPVDQFLVENLPLINNLNKFGLDKRKIGRGDKFILSTL